MAYKLIWALSARLDLKEIASYIAGSHPEASIRFVKSVFCSVEHLPNGKLRETYPMPLLDGQELTSTKPLLLTSMPKSVISVQKTMGLTAF